MLWIHLKRERNKMLFKKKKILCLQDRKKLVQILTTPFTSIILVEEAICLLAATEHAGNLNFNVFSCSDT